MDALAEFLGHEDVSRITPRFLSDWTDHLQQQAKPLSAKTVGQGYLAAVKRVFHVAKQRHRVEVDPAAGVTVDVPKPKRTRSPGFTDEEAEAIPSAALRPPEALGRMAEGNKQAIRWAPWVCAYIGARITEVTQLRKQDVQDRSGLPRLTFTPEAGSVKTGNYRVVRKCPVRPR